ncbi:signal peptidase II [Synechocystis sp. LKSZ1]|uniref:signal peptidase II n=1 Tax=Synechocystis sp. LKSZ1 TaxID=3144951 RepID=UPI00336C2985
MRLKFFVAPQPNYLFWFVAITGLILDQKSKDWVVLTFQEPGQTWPLIPQVFHFTYVLNTGAAFSAFRGGAGWLKWLSLGVSFALMIFAWKTPKLSRLEQIAYGCLLAGALGNGLDRFFLGHVVDFLDFRLINFPVFNLADVLINLGMIGLLLAHFPRSSVSPRP